MMKRYLLFMIACVCAVTGAWADPSVVPATLNGVSGYVVSGWNSGELATFLSGNSEEAAQVKSAAYVCLGSGTEELNQADINALSALTGVQYLRMDNCFAGEGAKFNQVTVGSTALLDVTLPTGLTKDQFKAANDALKATATGLKTTSGISGTVTTTSTPHYWFELNGETIEYTGADAAEGATIALTNYDMDVALTLADGYPVIRYCNTKYNSKETPVEAGDIINDNKVSPAYVEVPLTIVDNSSFSITWEGTTYTLASYDVNEVNGQYVLKNGYWTGLEQIPSGTPVDVVHNYSYTYTFYNGQYDGPTYTYTGTVYGNATDGYYGKVENTYPDHYKFDITSSKYLYTYVDPNDGQTKNYPAEGEADSPSETITVPFTGQVGPLTMTTEVTKNLTIDGVTVYVNEAGSLPDALTLLDGSSLSDYRDAERVTIIGTLNDNDVKFGSSFNALSGRIVDMSEADVSGVDWSNMTIPGNNSGNTPLNLILPSSFNLTTLPYSSNDLGNVLKYVDETDIAVCFLKPDALPLNASILNGRSNLQLQYLENYRNTVNGDVLNAINADDASLTSVDFTAMNGHFNLDGAALTLDNNNLTAVNLAGVNLNGNSIVKSLDVSGCSNLTTLNLGGATVGDVNAANTQLTTFTTNSDTWIQGDLHLENTASLTSFASTAKLGTNSSNGNIYLNASGVTTVDISGTQFQNTSSQIHVHATDESDNTVIPSLNVDGMKTILLPAPVKDAQDQEVHFDKNRIHPNTNLEDNMEEVAGAGVADFVINGCSVTVNMPEAGTFSTIWASVENELDEQIVGTDKRLCELKVTGPVNATDLASDAFKGINVDGVDFSEATFVNSNGETDYSIISSAKSNVIHYVVMPANTPSEIMVNSNFAGFTEFYSAGSYTELSTSGQYSLVATVKEEGELWGVTARMPVLGSTPTVTQQQNQTDNKYYITDITYTPNVVNLYEIHLKGNLNARDICPASDQAGFEMGKDGHLHWDKQATEIGEETRVLLTSSNAESKGLNLADYGKLVYGLATNTNNIHVIDFEGAEFSTISDMTISDKGVNLLGSNTTKVVLPTSSNVKEIPADFMNGSTNIRSICIPSNIETIRTRAFWTIDYVWTTSGANDPEGNNTRLDNGTQYTIDGEVVYASTDENFVYNRVSASGTYTFSSNLKLIETNAFANTQPHVKDVYVLNTVAPECHVDAFNKGMYLGWGGYNPTIIDDIITRDSYKNGDVWITMLHYPRQTTDPQIQRYTDPTRDYSIATGQRDGKGAVIYYPNQSEFYRAYNQGTYGYTWNAWNATRTYNSIPTMESTEAWNSDGQAVANGKYSDNTLNTDEKKYYTFYDVTLGNNTKPEGLIDYYKVNWDPSSYKYSEAESAGNLYPEGIDYRGWHQFVLNAYAANTVLKEEPYRSYITDNEWWTICPEFDITYNEAAILFGKANGITTSGSNAYPYISKLKYVRRNYANKTINLCFTGNLTQLKEVRDGDNKHGNVDQYGVMNPAGDATFNGDDIVMKSGVPYLIKPAFEPGAYRQFRIFSNQNDLNKYSSANSESNVVAFANETLYNKIHGAQEVSGEAQMADVKAGIYIVPAFVSASNGDGSLQKEAVVEGTEHKIGDIDYSVSAEWCYAFVGTFYKSFLPHYSYFLGWDSSLNGGKGGARFFYHEGQFDEIDNEMRWVNGTGVIVPVKKEQLKNGEFPFSVTGASGKDPAQWELLDKFTDDSFIGAGNDGTGARNFVVTFDAPDVTGDVTGVTETISRGSAASVDLKVYSVDGQLKGNSLDGLSKGLYIVNGKKYVVK